MLTLESVDEVALVEETTVDRYTGEIGR